MKINRVFEIYEGPPLWHPMVSIEPYCQYAVVEKFPVQLMPKAG
jgi:hypothetical protein